MGFEMWDMGCEMLCVMGCSFCVKEYNEKLFFLFDTSWHFR